MSLQNIFKIYIILTVVTLLSGCGAMGMSNDKTAKSHALIARDGLDILVEDASRKTTVIKDKGSLERFCRSPNPDFASGSSNSVSLGLPVGPSIGAGSGSEIDALGGRSSALLITRELMYRACELSLNLDANEALSKEIYWKFLATLEVALKNQTGAGSQGSTVSSNSSSAVPSAYSPLSSSTGTSPGLGVNLPNGSMINGTILPGGSAPGR